MKPNYFGTISFSLFLLPPLRGKAGTLFLLPLLRWKVGTLFLLPPLWGKVGMGGGKIQCNNLFYSLNIIHHIMVPKSYHLESLRPKPLGPDIIIILINRMLAAIQFNNKLLFEAYKIDNIFSDGSLSSKFKAHQLSTANMAPEFLFCVC